MRRIAIDLGLCLLGSDVGLQRFAVPHVPMDLLAFGPIAQSGRCSRHQLIEPLSAPGARTLAAACAIGRRGGLLPLLMVLHGESHRIPDADPVGGKR